MKKELKENISLIGFPIDLGSGRRGVDMGPSALRIAGLQKKLKDLGYKVTDTGDINIEIMERQKIGNLKLRYLDEILKTSITLAAKVESVLESNNFPLCIGGDHSMALGTIAGISSYCKKNKLKLGVIWIDAHTDMNTDRTTPSGNIHGMPLAAALGEDNIDNRINEVSKSSIHYWDNMKNLGAIKKQMDPTRPLLQFGKFTRYKNCIT